MEPNTNDNTQTGNDMPQMPQTEGQEQTPTEEQPAA
jgi:hypothetical protein